MSDVFGPRDGPALSAALTRLQALHPRAIDLGLSRIDRVCAALGRPERRLPPVIHVAGTNGKGSTVAFVRAAAEAAGLRTHVLTSPHLVRFVERLRLAGSLVDEPALVDALKRVERANAGAPLSFFEAVTAAQFLLMGETPADLAVVEVGLGGRHDATNLVAPAVAVIAPIALDHREFLGDTLELVAREKAGIVKPGAPVVVSHLAQAALEEVEAQAARAGARVLAAGRDWDAWGERGRLLVQWGERLYDLPPPALPGAHQFANAGLAVAALLAWGGAGGSRVDEAALAAGVAGARWPARMQRLTAGPLAAAAAARGSDLWLDGGHNPHAAAAVADFARTLAARDGRPLALIVGLLNTKDAVGVFAALAAADARMHLTGFAGPAAATPERLVEAAARAGVAARPHPDVAHALSAALAEPGPPPHVLVMGSLHLAGEVLALDRATWPQ